MPSCREEDLPYYFKLTQDYFNKVLKRPVKIFLADVEAVEYLKLQENPYYQISKQDDLKDYLYDAETVSYTHLDVYKRQVFAAVSACCVPVSHADVLTRSAFREVCAVL